ncbi:hypothetical protein PQQ51_09770 [Paraburkholderia xenovorans]|uniref:hypothetical protein n=1 Tax=Paraburkholderia xenovorans TaxID=36873 RepID=UPI0038BE1AA6
MRQPTSPAQTPHRSHIGHVPLIPILIGIETPLLTLADPAWGAAASVLFPLSLFIAVARRYRDLLDYRVIYLFALSVWAANHCSGIFFLLQGDSTQIQPFGGAMSLYSYGVTASTFLVLLFWKDRVHVAELRIDTPEVHGERLRFFAFLVVSVGYAIVVQWDSSLPIASMLSSFMLVAFATNQLSYARRGRWIALLLSGAYASAIFSLGAANRTSMLVPMVVTGLAALATRPRMDGRIFSLRTAFLIAALLAVALIADWQKQMHMSLFEAVTGDMRALPTLMSTAENSNYLTHADATLEYLGYIQYIIDHHIYHNGYYLMQVVSSFTPRALFPGKPNFDVSALLYDAHIVKMPMYFDFLFDRIIDSGFFGIVLYNLGYLWLTRTAYRMYDRVRAIRPLGVECGLYLAALITLYLVMRGPIILITWFYLFPMVLLALRNVAVRMLQPRRARRVIVPDTRRLSEERS